MNDLTAEQKREVQARIHSFSKCGQAFTRYNNTQQVFSWEGLQAVGTDVLIHYLAVFGRTKQKALGSLCTYQCDTPPPSWGNSRGKTGFCMPSEPLGWDI